MSTEVPPVVALLVRFFAFVCVLASIVMVANIPHVDEGEIMFNGFSAHKFTSPLGIIGIVIAYFLFQTSFVFVFTGDGRGGVMEMALILPPKQRKGRWNCRKN